MTENILCVDKDRTYPLRYNVQGCVGGRYTLELPMQNNSGICLSDMGLFMTVADLQPGKEQFNCYQDSRFTSMTIIVCKCLLLYATVVKYICATPSIVDGRNPYRDVIIEVNGEERENASDLVEGDKVKIVAQAVGSVGNIVDSAICSSGTHVTCSSSFLCNGSQSANRYFQYLFFPLTLAHDGIVVPFRTNDGNTLGNVTLHGKILYYTVMWEGYASTLTVVLYTGHVHAQPTVLIGALYAYKNYNVTLAFEVHNTLTICTAQQFKATATKLGLNFSGPTVAYIHSHIIYNNA